MPPEKKTPAPATPEGVGGKPKEPYPKPRPAGEPKLVVKTRAMIEKRLQQMFKWYFVDEHGNYVLGMGSARMFVVPAWLENDAAVIRVFAITNLDVPLTQELMEFLLAKNMEFVFGGFALDPQERAVWFNHNLLAEYTAPDEFEATLAAIAHTADELDDEIKGLFGGRLYVESPEQSVPSPSVAGYL
jgi:hypothetical protein